MSCEDAALQPEAPSPKHEPQRIPAVVQSNLETKHEDDEPDFDPYKPLDMYDSSKHTARPFRRIRIKAKAPEKGTAQHAPSEEWFSVPKASVNGCTHPEFDYILAARK